MNMALQIEAVYQRALLLRQRATEAPVQQDLLEAALRELALVLEELQASEEELCMQNQTLLMTRQQVESERQRYQDLFNLAPDGYLVTDNVGIIQEANVAIAAMLQVSQPYLINKPLVLFVTDVDRPLFYATLDQLKRLPPSRQPQPQAWEIQICRRDGTPLDVAITLSITCNSTSNEVIYRWLLHDITQQKQIKVLLEQLNTELEREVQERTAQLQQALDFETSLKRITDNVRDSLDEQQILQTVVQELTQVLDILGCETTFYDLSGQKSVGFCPEAVDDLNVGKGTTQDHSRQGDRVAIAASPTDANQVMPIPTLPDGYRQLLQGQYMQLCEITPTLVATPMAILICPIADEQTMIGGLHVFKPTPDTFSDSEIRLVQQVANQCAIAIRQARLYQTSQRQVQELKQLHQLKDTFLSTVSHELRTPLSNMNVAIQMLDLLFKQPEKFENNHSRMTRYLEILQTQCKQEINLINDLLDLSRLDASAEALTLTTVDLHVWLPPIVFSFEERIRGQQQQMQVNISTNLPAITTDASLLKRILIELLNNACKYTPAQGAIVIAVSPTEQAWQLSISNSGVDLPPHELARLFDKFYRVPTHDPWKCSGTGLGLALVKQQVEQLQGTIEVANLQSWITLTLQLPWSIN